ncbi:twin-arginine translocase subunit TatC [Legionella nagasakiensis]|uniref:twin-arginine translocase subunit TatC n=1 Tax=Legionella nagasakiensis TaxID=535290 RepID=UPI001055F151|nr:twin-arginine translocase subunit TatC [Legionella nagasakiensis]
MLNHLIELRRRLLHIASAFLALFILFFFSAHDLFHWVVSPLLKALPGHNGLIATQITSPLITPLRLAADAALLATTPFALYQVWGFVAPGLYHHERQNLRMLITISLLLFMIGVLFCFYIVLPLMLQFFVTAMPAEVRFLPDMAYAVDFITRMLFIFGLSFQVPLLCLLLVRLQLLQVATLKTIRPYVIVAAFTVGMLLTPPDVFSQVMLAIPLCLLYEMGILLTVFLQPKMP